MYVLNAYVQRISYNEETLKNSGCASSDSRDAREHGVRRLLLRAYIQTLLKTQGRELVIVNEAEEGQQDVMQDFVAIITSFCARLYGRRRASRKKTQILAALEVN